MRSTPQSLAIFYWLAMSMPRTNSTTAVGKSSGFTVVITGLLCYTAAAFKLLGYINWVKF
jgi:hypothetical protein